MSRSLLTCMAGLTLALSAPAQETRTIQVSVTSVSGRSVFLDRGTDAGIAIGAEVELFPPGGLPLRAIVQAVSTNSSRADLPPGTPLPPIGTHGALEVPIVAGTGETRRESIQRHSVPEHPPWERQEGEREPGQPLLSPAFGCPPDKRPVRIDGHVFGNLSYSRDSGRGRDSEYFLGELGTRLELTNPLGLGGRVQLAGVVDRRGTDLSTSGSENDSNARLDRLSYSLGGEEYAPYRAEIGRFQSVWLPEIGLLDGVEGALQFEDGLSAGAGFGAYPLPFPSHGSGEDTSLHVFTAFQSDDENHLAAALGYQQTWHKGAPDRNLLIARISLHPTPGVYLYGSAQVDFYTSSDVVKGSGPELSEAWLQARYSVVDWGTALSYSHYRWPELKRREYQNAPVDLIADGRVSRVDWSAWAQVTAALRVRGRLDFWEDQTTDGLGGEIGADWRGALHPQTTLSGSVFFAEGSFIDGPGLRLQARHRFGDFHGFVGYEYFRYTTADLLGGNESADRQVARLGLDWSPGRWTWSLSGDWWFGNGEDAYALGLYATYHF